MCEFRDPLKSGGEIENLWSIYGKVWKAGVRRLTAHADENICTVCARRLLHACRVSARCREALGELRMLSCSAVLCD
eukprot:4822918-Prymnesium_polylepis.1